jgi:hypothetical protein
MGLCHLAKVQKGACPLQRIVMYRQGPKCTHSSTISGTPAKSECLHISVSRLRREPDWGGAGVVDSTQR